MASGAEQQTHSTYIHTLHITLGGKKIQNVADLFHSTISRRAIPPKYFENIFKTNDSVGVTRQQTWLRNEEIAEYFGENLDILTDLNMDFQ